ncbi:hypothetical protein [Corynebacterium aquatimens]|uniref:Uncharacterized protein n=1 Tax=Corynebacterium aquatimens TaxID=1190508 RepID=A0A931GS29_9CORY|nr:hypothetical protein [Corynebacterium aquatimens]MBG6122608.1 hypothetical protein [Corynebacterium aquatimens]
MTLSSRQHITIGRSADFTIGASDPGMHRHLFHFWDSDGDWLVKNVGSLITARIVPAGNVRFLPLRLAPGDVLYVPAGRSTVGWSTKEADYAIKLTNATVIREPQVRAAFDRRATNEHFVPSAEQRMLLNALAAPLVEDPMAEAHIVVPSVDKLAVELGWTRKKTEQKMLRIVDALERAGVPEFQRSENRAPWRILLARFAFEQYGRG